MTGQHNVDLEALLSAYEVDVRFPDVSGMEQINMLQTRSAIANHEAALTAEQRVRLAAADQQLVRQARQFYASVRQIADLAAWRLEEEAPIEHWWWYLDVLAQVPAPAETSLGQPEPARL